MVGSVGAIQGILVAAFLILGGLGKLFELDPEKRRRSLLGSITGGWSLARPASLLLAGAECWLGMAVVFGRWVPLPEVASALFLATAGATLALGVRAMPGADCGCLGAVGSARIGWRTVTRAGYLQVSPPRAHLPDGRPSAGWTMSLPSPRHLARLLFSSGCRQSSVRARSSDDCPRFSPFLAGSVGHPQLRWSRESVRVTSGLKRTFRRPSRLTSGVTAVGASFVSLPATNPPTRPPSSRSV